MTGRHDRVQMMGVQFGTRDQGGNLLLFDHFPINEVFDIRVIDIDNHHLRCTSCRAAGLDRARGLVPDFQEAHQARGSTAP